MNLLNNVKEKLILKEQEDNERNKKIAKLADYYKDKGLTIIGLNDSQGVNISVEFFKKGMLDYVAKALTTEEVHPTVINAFSLLLNKTEYIDYFLDYNLSLEQIKLSQIYSAIGAVEKIAKDCHLPLCLGQVGNLYRMVYKFSQGDEKIFITETLKKSKEPVVVYCGGPNNLMRDVGSNPSSILWDYIKKNHTANFNYTLDKSRDATVLANVMGGIEKNFIHILDINDKADIYALGSYVPKSLRVRDLTVFRDLILRYNEALEQLCKYYGAVYIDTEAVGDEYSKSFLNFHVNSNGHMANAYKILDAMYCKKIENLEVKLMSLPNDFVVPENDIDEFLLKLSNEYNQSNSLAWEMKAGYPRERQFEIANEYLEAMHVIRRVKERR